MPALRECQYAGQLVEDLVDIQLSVSRGSDRSARSTSRGRKFAVEHGIPQSDTAAARRDRESTAYSPQAVAARRIEMDVAYASPPPSGSTKMAPGAARRFDSSTCSCGWAGVPGDRSRARRRAADHSRPRRVHGSRWVNAKRGCARSSRRACGDDRPSISSTHAWLHAASSGCGRREPN